MSSRLRGSTVGRVSLLAPEYWSASELSDAVTWDMYTFQEVLIMSECHMRQGFEHVYVLLEVSG